jgi:hypothetical protein
LVEIALTQTESSYLIGLEKWRADERVWSFPLLGQALDIGLDSADRRESFILTISRSRIVIAKQSYQTRARQAIVLVRLDIGGAPHRNPDDTEIACPHLHVYREGFGAKWAESLPTSVFPAPLIPAGLWSGFLKYCNITKPPVIQGELF